MPRLRVPDLRSMVRTGHAPGEVAACSRCGASLPADGVGVWVEDVVGEAAHPRNSLLLCAQCEGVARR